MARRISKARLAAPGLFGPKFDAASASKPIGLQKCRAHLYRAMHRKALKREQGWKEERNQLRERIKHLELRWHPGDLGVGDGAAQPRPFGAGHHVFRRSLLEGIDVAGDPVHRYVDVVLVVPIYAVGMERLAGDEDEHLEVGGARIGIDFAD